MCSLTIEREKERVSRMRSETIYFFTTHRGRDTSLLHIEVEREKERVSCMRSDTIS